MNTDEQILQDAWYGRESTADSGTIEEEQGDDAPETTEVEEETETTEVESDEDGDDTEPEQKNVEDVAPKKKSNSNFAKILAERNALRRQLQEKIDSSYDKESMKDIESLIEERAERKIEDKLFFRDHPEAKGIADEIRSVASEHNMDIETAYKFYVSVIDPQTLAKSESKKISVSGTSRKVIASNDEFSAEKKAQMSKAYADQYIR